MDKEDKFIDLKISPFQLPFLRDLGIKVVAMITFDLMYGPICYLRELSRSNFSYLCKYFVFVRSKFLNKFFYLGFIIHFQK